MNKFTKKQILIGGLILLFVINLAALGTVIYQNYRYKWDKPSGFFGRNDWPSEERQKRGRWMEDKDKFQDKGKDTGHGFEYYIKKRLNLDEEQFEKFQTMSEENMQSLWNIAHELSQKRDTLMKELSMEDPDTVMMKRLADEIGDLHTQLKKNTINHFMQMKKLCRPEQRDELNEMIMEMSHHGKFETGRGMGPKGRPNHMNRK